jgi:adenosylmethionine-8-amino-7-oxononanoate aminotransferase
MARTKTARAKAKSSKSQRPRAARRRRGPRHLVCAFTSPAAVEANGTIRLVRGKGAFVRDDQGNRYIDGLSSLWNVNVGHGRKEIAAALARQTRTLQFAPTLLGFSSEPAEKLATRIAKMAPRGLDRVLFTSGGSEANESVIRLVRLYQRLRGKPDKIRIVALNRAYHGSSTGAVSLTGMPNFHQYYEPLMPGVLRIPRPYCYRCELGRTYPECGLACANELERLIETEGADTIGAVIAEPVQGVGGVIVPPDDYFRRLREICDRHDVLLVADEVITGFGRLGRRFGIQRFGVTPDMISFAKGVTSGYLPLGGVILSEAIFATILAQGPGFLLHHGFTYSGHPVACTAGLENLRILDDEKLIERVAKLAPYFAQRLEALRRHAIVGDVRCAGMMGAVELVQDRATRASFPADDAVPARVRAACLARGVILRASVENISICPPFVIKRKDLDTLFDVLDNALAEVGAALAAAGATPAH